MGFGPPRASSNQGDQVFEPSTRSLVCFSVPPRDTHTYQQCTPLQQQPKLLHSHAHPYLQCTLSYSPKYTHAVRLKTRALQDLRCSGVAFLRSRERWINAGDRVRTWRDCLTFLAPAISKKKKTHLWGEMSPSPPFRAVDVVLATYLAAGVFWVRPPR